ncbi:MAG TPA: hypothetical protein VK875_06090 [Euzebyales bacterium]|nr:hypothetical protein [Euzebyales bacterium]
MAASVALSAPTLLATVVHRDVFDFGRWQAWAWVMLFTAAPPFWAGLLVANRSLAPRRQARAGRAAVAGLLALALACGAAGLLLWIDPEAGSRVVPFRPSPLGGRFLGSWMGFLGVMAAWTALRPAEARLCLVALAIYPAGAFAAGLRSFADLSPPAGRWAYLVLLAGMSLVFGTALMRTWTPRTDLVESGGSGGAQPQSWPPDAPQ